MGGEAFNYNISFKYSKSKIRRVARMFYSNYALLRSIALAVFFNTFTFILVLQSFYSIITFGTIRKNNPICLCKSLEVTTMK